MKITIKDENQTLTLDNDMLDVPALVDVTVETPEHIEITVPIDELYSAALAFKELSEARKDD